MDSNLDVKLKQEKQDLIAKQVIAIAKGIKCKFTLKNQEIAVEKAFSALGLLPAIARRADQLSTFCMGYGLGVTFDRADNSILGVSVYFNDQVAISLRLLCITDVILEIVYSSSSSQLVPLDSLLDE